MVLRILAIFLLVSCVGTDTLKVELVPPRVEIVSFPDSLKVNDTFQFEAQYFDSIGNPGTRQFQWSSANSDILTITETGLATGVQKGVTSVSSQYREAIDEVTVIVDEVTSASNTIRSGTLQGKGGYKISGDFKIYESEGKTILEFISAQIDNSAPGPYYYLSNEINSVTGGIMLGVAESGDSSYTLPDDVMVNTYDVVIVWCEPFGVTLGYGEFKN